MILYQDKLITKADVVRVRRRVNDTQSELGSLYKCPGGRNVIQQSLFGPGDLFIVFHTDPDGIEDVDQHLPPAWEFKTVLDVQRAGWILETDGTT